MITEVITLNQERNVTLTVYRHTPSPEYKQIQKRPLIVVLPGGGYTHCSAREADPIALKYLAEGFNACVLRYTLRPVGVWPQPLEDYEQAMEIIKQNAENWQVDVDRIATCGFSAGGHLAGCTATIAKNKPTAAILVYAVLDNCSTRYQPSTVPQPTQNVTSDTCPCFLASVANDQVVPIENTIKMELALAKNSVPFESHIYSYGTHGFATGHPAINDRELSARVKNWMADSIQWLEEVWGPMTYTGFGERKSFAIEK